MGCRFAARWRSFAGAHTSDQQKLLYPRVHVALEDGTLRAGYVVQRVSGQTVDRLVASLPAIPGDRITRKYEKWMREMEADYDFLQDLKPSNVITDGQKTFTAIDCYIQPEVRGEVLEIIPKWQHYELPAALQTLPNLSNKTSINLHQLRHLVTE